MSGNNWRERIAWIAVAVGTGYVLLTLLDLVRADHVLHRGVERAAAAVGGQSVPTAVLVALTAAALSCGLAQPATPSAPRVLRAASLVAVGSAVLDAVLVLLGLLSPVGRDRLGVVTALLGLVLTVGLKLAAAGAMRHVAASLQNRDAAAPDRAPAAPGTPAVASEDGARATGQPAGVAPTWSPDQAMGTVWNRAGDAATGAAGHQEAASASWQPPRTTDGTRQLAQDHGSHHLDSNSGASTTGWNASDAGAAPAPSRPRSAWTTAADLAQGGELPASRAGDADPGAPRSAPVWRASDE